MTDLRKAAEALRLAEILFDGNAMDCLEHSADAAAELRRLHKENQTLRQALAQPEQEPVGWLNANEGVDVYAFTWRKKETHDIPLYTAPPSIEAAVLAEREACAKVCDEWNTAITDKLAAEIRARSEK